MNLTVTINDGSLAGRSFDLETGFLTVGRGENCSIRFDPQLERIASKQHAFIEARPDGFYLTDNNSTNGTLLNGERIDSPRKLSAGDVIQFGRNGTTASVSISSAAATAPSIKSPEEFRERQVEQFAEAATQQPVSLQNSFANLGLGKIEVKPKSTSTGKYIGIALTVFVLIFIALFVTLIFFFLLGPIPAFIGAVVAFTPAIIYLLPFIWIDRYDPEPLWLFSLAYAWGALVAVFVSFIVNTLVGTIVAIGVSPVAGQVVGAVISAPVFEEGSKGLGLVILLVFFRKYFDDILDGIVFAGVIALGFATVENVLYYGRAVGEAGLGGLIVLFVMRGILSPFAHVTFTSMTGIGCGISRESHNMIVRILMPLIGYAAAVTLHAIWNGMAVIGGLQGFLAGYLLLEIPFFFIFVGFAFYVMYRQNKILKEMLAMDIARGLIPQEHAATATSAFKSSAWVLGGIFNGKFRPRNRYVRAIGKLGLSYWHIQRATAAQGQTASFQQNPILREEVLKWRDQV